MISGKHTLVYQEFLRFRGVLIDIDDTLYSYQEAHDVAIREVYNKVVIFQSLDFLNFKERYVKYRKEVADFHGGTAATRSRFLAFQKLLEYLGYRPAYNKALDAEDVYWSSLIAIAKPYEHVLGLLKYLVKHDIPVCAVTDMQARVQAQKLRQFGITNYVDYLVTSEEVGCEKPNETIFLRAIEKLHATPDTVAMVGDNIKKDILGSQKLGIAAWQVTTENILEIKF